MPTHPTRRNFIHSTLAAGGTVVGLAELGFLNRLKSVSAADATLNRDAVRFGPEIEPLVRLLEETPRDQLLERVASGIQDGLSYREVLAALLLAGVRNVEPRPSVGFKFHAVLVVNSAHLASLASPDSERWLPVFWALDYFKDSQARDQQERQWTMSPVDEANVPRPSQALAQFTAAMDDWDEAAADAAVVALARSATAGEIFEQLFRYGARDFRSIGHKAIFVANSYRTLNCIGWHHAEPVLRSLAYALLNHEGEADPDRSDYEADRPWRQHEALAKQFRADWQDGNLDDAATTHLLATLRTGTWQEASAEVVDTINRGVAPQSVWDALFAAAAEQILCQPGILPLHAATSTNALHFAYQMTASDDTRRRLLLQNAAFIAMFRARLADRGDVATHLIDQLEPAAVAESGDAAVAEVFADVHRDPFTASRKCLAYLADEQAAAKPIVDAARRFIYVKGSNAHDYKFSSAVLEDYRHVSRPWRDRYLAASMMLLRGPGHQDNPLVERTRAAFA